MYLGTLKPGDYVELSRTPLGNICYIEKMERNKFGGEWVLHVLRYNPEKTEWNIKAEEYYLHEDGTSSDINKKWEEPPVQIDLADLQTRRETAQLKAVERKAKAAERKANAAPRAKAPIPPLPVNTSTEPPPMPTLDHLLPFIGGLTSNSAPATERQVAAIKRLGIAGDPSIIDTYQASAILSCRSYGIGVIHALSGYMRDHQQQQLIEAALTAFILSNRYLKERAVAWNIRSFRRGAAKIPRPRRDEHFQCVEAEAKRLFRVLDIGHRERGSSASEEEAHQEAQREEATALRVDCWRLLDLQPGASAAEVRTAFAKRARDVHPDSGGTGDGLTMSLLIEARDEALSLIEMPGKTGSPTAASSHTNGTERQRTKARPKVRTHPCYVCNQPFPRDQLNINRIYRGFRGRPTSGRVLMCRSCIQQIEEHYRKEQEQVIMITVGGIILMIIIGVITIAVRGY